MNVVVEEKRGSGPVIGGWICLAVGVGLMFASLLLFLLYAPLFLAAFVLGIVAIAQKRPGQGIAILLLSIILPIFFGLGLGAMRWDQVKQEVEKAEAQQRETEQKAAAANSLLMTSQVCEEFGGRTRAKYSFVNNGAGSIEFAKIYVSFEANGKTLETEDTYLDQTTLPPGSTTTANVYGPAAATNCRLTSVQDRNGNQIKVGGTK